MVVDSSPETLSGVNESDPWPPLATELTPTYGDVPCCSARFLSKIGDRREDDDAQVHEPGQLLQQAPQVLIQPSRGGFSRILADVVGPDRKNDECGVLKLEQLVHDEIRGVPPELVLLESMQSPPELVMLRVRLEQGSVKGGDVPVRLQVAVPDQEIVDPHL